MAIDIERVFNESAHNWTATDHLTLYEVQDILGYSMFATKAWFISLNSRLGGIAPIDLVGLDDDSIIAAARIYTQGVMHG